MKKSDVLIIGTGVAGCSTAIYLAQQNPDVSITMITKNKANYTNTSYAQGGIAAVWDLVNDSFQKHIDDTLDAGDGLCDPEIVKIVVEEGKERVEDLIQWGTHFDKEHDGTDRYDLGREGGHSENRILHFKDKTGWEIQRSMLEMVKKYDNIELIEEVYAVELITQHHLGHNVTRVSPDIKCYGAHVLEKQEDTTTERYLAKVTVIASGGGGQVYKATTNPVIATGDGIAMVYRAKGHIENMEFVQFHPTSLYDPEGENPSFLISEAVRGEGAILRTKDGKEFMQKYDKRKSLAPRDIVARAIDREMKARGEDFVYLDCTHLDPTEFKEHFPTIYDKCISKGIDPMKDFIPVVPACHYVCGGIRTDEHGRTSINRLYAAGESTCTGLHGANRLASNSLLEGLVFGKRIADDINSCISEYEIREDIPRWNAEGTMSPEELVLFTQSWKELKDIMSYYVGIVRNNIRLKRALDRLYIIYKETEDLYQTTTLSPQLCELRNLITTSYLITNCAQMRKESRGLHYNTDFPEKHDFIDNIVI